MSEQTKTVVQTKPIVQHDLPWNVILWNDPINLMEYVIKVLQKVFGYQADLAHKLTMEAHAGGKALVATEPREQAEMHAQKLHEFGLQATIQRQDG